MWELRVTSEGEKINLVHVCKEGKIYEIAERESCIEGILD